MSLDIVYAYMEDHPDDTFGDTDEILSWANGELAALREQVKVLRAALQELVEVNPVISFSHKGAFEYISAVEKARLILKQTKPKEGE